MLDNFSAVESIKKKPVPALIFQSEAVATAAHQVLFEKPPTSPPLNQTGYDWLKRHWQHLEHCQ